MNARTKFALTLAALAALAGVLLLLLQGGGRAPEEGAASTRNLADGEAPPPVAAAAASDPAATAPARSLAKAGEPELPEAYARALSGLLGRVVEPDGRPVPGVPVELLGGLIEFFALDIDKILFEPESFDVQITQQKRSTDAEGRFRFEQVDPRGYYLLGINLGKGRPQIRFVDRAPLPGETVDLGDLALDPPLALTGRVVDEGGRGVAGARVRATTIPPIAFQAGIANLQPGTAILVRAGQGKNAPRIFWKLPRFTDALFEKLPAPHTTTAPDGSFRLEGAPAGILTLVVDGPTVAPSFQGPIPATKASEKNVGEIAVSRGEDVAIEVVDEQDKPVPRAEVMVGIPSPLAAEFVAFLRKPIACDERGQGTAPHVAARKIVLVARAPDTLDWTVGALAEVTGDPIQIKVPAPRSIVVKVEDKDGKPLEAVIAIQRGIEGLSLFPALEPPFTTKPERLAPGVFRVRGLQRGAYIAYARAPGYAIGKERVEIKPKEMDEEPVCVLRLEPEYAMEVTVLGKEAGQPVPLEQATVFGLPERNLEKLGFMALGNAKTNAQGVARVGALGQGPYRIIATHPAYATGWVKTEIPGPKASTIQLLAGGTLEGQAVRGGVAPEKPMMVVIAPNRNEIPQPPRTTVTDLEGKFRYSHLYPGKYRIVVTPRFLGDSLNQLNPMEVMRMAGENAEQDVEIVDEQTTQAIVDLEKGGRRDRPDDGFLRGTASVNGMPAEGDYVLGVGAEFVRPKAVDAAGSFDLGRVRPGDYTLSLSRRGGPAFGNAVAERRVKVQAGETTFVDFNVRTGRLRGRVLDEANKPISGARVRLAARGSTANLGPPRAVSGDGGAFSIEEVASGSYALTASYEDLVSAEVAAEVPSGGTSSEVVIRLRASASVEGTLEAKVPEGARFAMLSFLSRRGAGEPDGAPVQADTSVNLETRTFRARRLPPGSYRVALRVFGPDGPRGFRAVDLDVAPGSATGVALRFEELAAGERDPFPDFPFGGRR